MRSAQIFARVVYTIVGLVFIASCTHFRAELKPPPPQINAKQPVPIAVGAYFPESLRKYEATYAFADALAEALGLPEVYIFPMGNASIPLFLDAMYLVFSEVQVVESLPSPGINLNLRRILSFEIEHVDIFFGRTSVNKNLVKVIYRIRAYDMKAGEELTWTVTGTAMTVNTGSLIRPPSSLTQAVEMAMRDAAEKFVLSFQDVPEVRQWLENLANSGKNSG